MIYRDIKAEDVAQQMTNEFKDSFGIFPEVSLMIAQKAKDSTNDVILSVKPGSTERLIKMMTDRPNMVQIKGLDNVDPDCKELDAFLMHIADLHMTQVSRFLVGAGLMSGDDVFRVEKGSKVNGEVVEQSTKTYKHSDFQAQ